MGIVINKLSFTNYRQYGTGSLSFNADGESKLTAIIAKNGTGKTTILNAITWCLYDKELHLPDEKKALPVVTSAIVRDAAPGQMIPTAVSITLTDDENTVVFKRTMDFKVSIDVENNKRVIGGKSHLTATVTKIGEFANTIVKSDVDADIIVKQYFDEAIFQFYFFDGEKLRDFFAASQATSIKQSIFNISQVTLLERACDRLYKLSSDRRKKLEKDSPNLAKLNKQLDDQNRLWEGAVKMEEQQRELVDELSKEKERLDELLRGYDPVKKLQLERDQLTKDMAAIEDEEADLRVERTSFIRKYYTLLALYPRIVKTLEIIQNKEAAGDLPPAIDRDLIKRLLAHPDQHCPICDSSIDETAIEHIQNLLNQFSVSSATSNYLKELKSTMELAIDDVSNYKQRLNFLRQKETDIRDRKSEAEKRMGEIAASLSSFEDSTGKIDVSGNEARRTNLTIQINNANQAIGSARTTSDNCAAEVDRIEAEIAAAIKKLGEHKDMQKQIEVIEMLYSNFKRIKTSIMDDMKKEIELTTWNFFDQMIWKKNTFGRIKINDSYDISVFDKDGTEMTGSLSATEQMALAYAFTLAIHKASGKNCPLVIDSPLGRVSDENRANMAAALKNVSQTKQIVMLFTPDEYSTEVKSIYDGTAEVRNLRLSDDESFVEGM